MIGVSLVFCLSVSDIVEGTVLLMSSGCCMFRRGFVDGSGGAVLAV